MPDATSALHAALAAQQAGHWSDAEMHLHHAATADPTNYLVPMLAGNLHERQSNPAAAAEAYEQAARLAPQRPETHFNLGNTQWRLDHHPQAEASFRRALQLRPDYDAAWRNLSFVLREQGRALEAWHAFRPVRQRASLDPQVVRHEGLLAWEAGHPDHARAAFEAALRLAPDLAETHVNLATLLFHAGDLSAAWEHYAWRWKSPALPPPIRHGALPTCDTLPPPSARLLVVGEQGLGDEIMFASCFPELLQRVDRALLRCDRRLVHLFARAFPTATVVPAHDAAECAPIRDHDLTHQILAGTACGWFRRGWSDFPRRAAFLQADPALVGAWRDRLAALSARPKVGIAWRGGAPGIEQRLRSTALELWHPLLAIEGVDFVNLQYGTTAGELAQLRQAAPGRFHHFADVDPLVDLDHSAALISSLDLVVAVSQAGVHLAGALGVPTWNLLRFAADWRWFQCCADDSPWYPSLRLFRQPAPGAWPPLFHRLHSEFLAWLSRDRNLA